MSLPTNPCDHVLGETAELTRCQDEIQHPGMIDDMEWLGRHEENECLR